MAINIQQGWDVRSNEPIDARSVAATLTARNALNTNVLYEGLMVYVTAEDTAYILTDVANASSNSGWTAVGSSMPGADNRIPTPAAADQGEILVATGSGTYELQQFEDGVDALVVSSTGSFALGDNTTAQNNPVTMEATIGLEFESFDIAQSFVRSLGVTVRFGQTTQDNDITFSDGVGTVTLTLPSGTFILTPVPGPGRIPAFSITIPFANLPGGVALTQANIDIIENDASTVTTPNTTQTHLKGEVEITSPNSSISIGHSGSDDLTLDVDIANVDLPTTITSVTTRTNTDQILLWNAAGTSQSRISVSNFVSGLGGGSGITIVDLAAEVPTSPVEGDVISVTDTFTASSVNFVPGLWRWDSTTWVNVDTDTTYTFNDTANNGNTLGVDFTTNGTTITGTVDASSITAGGGVTAIRASHPPLTIASNVSSNIPQTWSFEFPTTTTAGQNELREFIRQTTTQELADSYDFASNAIIATRANSQVRDVVVEIGAGRIATATATEVRVSVSGSNILARFTYADNAARDAALTGATVSEISAIRTIQIDAAGDLTGAVRLIATAPLTEGHDVARESLTIGLDQSALRLTASQITDFDAEVTNNTSVVSNTAKPDVIDATGTAADVPNGYIVVTGAEEWYYNNTGATVTGVSSSTDFTAAGWIRIGDGGGSAAGVTSVDIINELAGNRGFFVDSVSPLTSPDRLRFRFSRGAFEAHAIEFLNLFLSTPVTAPANPSTHVVGGGREITVGSFDPIGVSVGGTPILYALEAATPPTYADVTIQVNSDPSSIVAADTAVSVESIEELNITGAINFVAGNGIDIAGSGQDVTVSLEPVAQDISDAEYETVIPVYYDNDRAQVREFTDAELSGTSLTTYRTTTDGTAGYTLPTRLLGNAAGLAQLVVTLGVSVQTRGTDYTVDSNDGGITFTTAPASGMALAITYAEGYVDRFGGTTAGDISINTAAEAGFYDIVGVDSTDNFHRIVSVTSGNPTSGDLLDITSDQGRWLFEVTSLSRFIGTSTDATGITNLRLVGSFDTVGRVFFTNNGAGVINNLALFNLNTGSITFATSKRAIGYSDRSRSWAGDSNDDRRIVNIHGGFLETNEEAQRRLAERYHDAAGQTVAFKQNTTFGTTEATAQQRIGVLTFAETQSTVSTGGDGFRVVSVEAVARVDAGGNALVDAGGVALFNRRTTLVLPQESTLFNELSSRADVTGLLLVGHVEEVARRTIQRISSFTANTRTLVLDSVSTVTDDGELTILTQSQAANAPSVLGRILTISILENDRPFARAAGSEGGAVVINVSGGANNVDVPEGGTAILSPTYQFYNVSDATITITQTFAALSDAIAYFEDAVRTSMWTRVGDGDTITPNTFRPITNINSDGSRTPVRPTDTIVLEGGTGIDVSLNPSNTAPETLINVNIPEQGVFPDRLNFGDIPGALVPGRALTFGRDSQNRIVFNSVDDIHGPQGIRGATPELIPTTDNVSAAQTGPQFNRTAIPNIQASLVGRLIEAPSFEAPRTAYPLIATAGTSIMSTEIITALNTLAEQAAQNTNFYNVGKLYIVDLTILNGPNNNEFGVFIPSETQLATANYDVDAADYSPTGFNRITIPSDLPFGGREVTVQIIDAGGNVLSTLTPGATSYNHTPGSRTVVFNGTYTNTRFRIVYRTRSLNATATWVNTSWTTDDYSILQPTIAVGDYGYQGGTPNDPWTPAAIAEYSSNRLNLGDINNTLQTIRYTGVSDTELGDITQYLNRGERVYVQAPVNAENLYYGQLDPATSGGDGTESPVDVYGQTTILSPSGSSPRIDREIAGRLTINRQRLTGASEIPVPVQTFDSVGTHEVQYRGNNPTGATVTIEDTHADFHITATGDAAATDIVTPADSPQGEAPDGSTATVFGDYTITSNYVAGTVVHQLAAQIADDTNFRTAGRRPGTIGHEFVNNTPLRAVPLPSYWTDAVDGNSVQTFNVSNARDVSQPGGGGTPSDPALTAAYRAQFVPGGNYASNVPVVNGTNITRRIYGIQYLDERSGQKGRWLDVDLVSYNESHTQVQNGRDADTNRRYGGPSYYGQQGVDYRVASPPQSQPLIVGQRTRWEVYEVTDANGQNARYWTLVYIGGNLVYRSDYTTRRHTGNIDTTDPLLRDSSIIRCDFNLVNSDAECVIPFLFESGAITTDASNGAGLAAGTVYNRFGNGRTDLATSGPFPFRWSAQVKTADDTGSTVYTYRTVNDTVLNQDNTFPYDGTDIDQENDDGSSITTSTAAVTIGATTYQTATTRTITERGPVRRWTVDMQRRFDTYTYTLNNFIGDDWGSDLTGVVNLRGERRRIISGNNGPHTYAYTLDSLSPPAITIGGNTTTDVNGVVTAQGVAAWTPERLEYVFVRQNGWTSGYLEVQSVAGNSNYYLSETNDDGITITWQPSNITTPRPWRIVGLHKVVSEISQADPAGPTFVELTNAERVAGSTTDVEFTFSTASKHHYDNNTRIITPSFDQRTFTGDSTVNTIGFDINGPLYLLGARSPDAGVFLWENGLLLNDLDLVAYQGEIYRLDTTNGTATAPLEIVDLGDVIVQSVADLPMPIASPTNNYAVSDPIGTLATAAGTFASGLLTLNLSNLPTISDGVNYVFDSGTGTITAPITRFVLRFGGDRITVVSPSQITINLAASSTLSTVEELVGSIPTTGGTFDGNAELPPQLREAGGAGTGYGVGNLVRLLYQDGSNGPGLWQVSSDGTSWIAANDTVKPTDPLATAFGWVNTDDTILHDPRFPTDTPTDRISNGSFLRWNAVDDVWVETTPSQVWDTVFTDWSAAQGYVENSFVVDRSNTANRLFRATSNFQANSNPFIVSPFDRAIQTFGFVDAGANSYYFFDFGPGGVPPRNQWDQLSPVTPFIATLTSLGGTPVRSIRFDSNNLFQAGNQLRIFTTFVAPGTLGHPLASETFLLNSSSIRTLLNQPPSFEVDNASAMISARWEEYSASTLALGQDDIENAITDNANFRDEIGINNGSVTGQILSWNNTTREWVVGQATEETIEDWVGAVSYAPLVTVHYNGALYRTTASVTPTFSALAGTGVDSTGGAYQAATGRWVVNWQSGMAPTIEPLTYYSFAIGDQTLMTILGGDIIVDPNEDDRWFLPTGANSFRYITMGGFTETTDPTSDRNGEPTVQFQSTTLPPPARLTNEWDRLGPPRQPSLAWAIASTGQFRTSVPADLNPTTQDVVMGSSTTSEAITGVSVIHYEKVINAELPGTAGNVSDWYEWINIEMVDILDPAAGFITQSGRSVYSTSGTNPLGTGVTTIPAF